MDQWIPIIYSGFYDVPRFFLTSYDGRQYLFDCLFDDDLDDYPNSYPVYLVLADADLKSSWEHLPQLAKRFLGTVAISQVQFDPTKRSTINSAIIGELTEAPSVISKVA